MNYTSEDRRIGIGGVLTGIVLAIALIAFIAFVSAAQVSSSNTGRRIMARTAGEMTELDRSIGDIEASLRESAGQSDQDPVRVPNFPIPVDIARANALAFDRQQLRDEILSQSGKLMYESGVGVWDDTDPDALQSIGTGSTAGGIRGALGFVRGVPHKIYLVLAIVSGLAAAALAVAFSLQMDALRRLLVLGAVLLPAGLAGLLVVFLVRLVTGSIGDGPFADSLSSIAVDAQGVALRNYAIVAALGAALVTLGFGGSLMESRENVPGGRSFGQHP